MGCGFCSLKTFPSFKLGKDWLNRDVTSPLLNGRNQGDGEVKRKERNFKVNKEGRETNENGNRNRSVAETHWWEMWFDDNLSREFCLTKSHWLKNMSRCAAETEHRLAIQSSTVVMIRGLALLNICAQRCICTLNSAINWYCNACALLRDRKP